jgi:hypothetical protein
MRRSWIPPRRPGPLPEILLAENDEVLSSWLTRSAALCRVRPETLLEQLGIAEIVPAALDRRALPMDLERLSIAMRLSPEAIRRMTFTGEPPEALEFVAHRLPLWTCRRCASEFAGRDLAQVRLRSWFVAIASRCGAVAESSPLAEPGPAKPCTISSPTASLMKHTPRSGTGLPTRSMPAFQSARSRVR